MGRQLRRVALNFEWPLHKPWSGFLNPLYVATTCVACYGTGASSTARHLSDKWYGRASFTPEERGSEPFASGTWEVYNLAKRNVLRSPEHYGSGQVAVEREVNRLCDLFNGRWSHHLNDADVAALVAANRLLDLTHTWSKETGWKPRDPFVVPTARQVNLWSLSGLGHDGINQHVVVKAECERLGADYACTACAGHGVRWPSPEAKAAYDAWEPEEPPPGDAYQMWETVSEGSPISPPFATPEELARYLTDNPSGIDVGTTYETWLAFIRGPGWAPSLIGSAATGIQSGVRGMVDLSKEN